MRLNNQVAIVTGASKGIGEAIALGLAREGAKVVVNYRKDTQAAEKVAEKIEGIGAEYMLCMGDTGKRADMELMYNMVLDRFGTVDILVNNAGVTTIKGFLELTDEDWDRVIGTNLTGYFICGQCAAKHMTERMYGKIINISSVRQVQASFGQSAYCSAKAGVSALTRVMALELAPYKINVNCIAPGTIETDLNRYRVSGDTEFRRQRLSRIPLGRIGQPEDIVGTVVFLATPGAEYITGTTIVVDGGQVIW